MRETVVVKEVLVPAEARTLVPFAPNAAQQKTLGITARELEILTLIARGLSNREIATQLSFPKTPSRHTAPAPSTSSEPPVALRRSSAAKN